MCLIVFDYLHLVEVSLKLPSVLESVSFGVSRGLYELFTSQNKSLPLV